MQKKHIASALAVGAVLVLAVPASATAAQPRSGTIHHAAPTGLHLAAEPDVTVDIRVELDLPNSGSSGPMVFAVNGIIVSGDIELPAGNAPIENPTDWCGDASVDVAEDLSSITVTGGEDSCSFEEAHVIVTLHGGTFGTVTLGEDTLFEPGEFLPESFVTSSGGGAGALSAGMHKAVVANPTLQSATSTGAVFEAYWLGTESRSMSGSATFNLAAATDAEGAEPVAADPNFTG